MIDEEIVDATVARYYEAKAAKGENPAAGDEWQVGKTVEDLKFISEAEKAIAFLQEAIDAVKAGQLTTQVEITPVDLLVKRKELFGE